MIAYGPEYRPTAPTGSPNRDWHRIYKIESQGTYGFFGLQILVSSPVEQLDTDKISLAINKAADRIQNEVMAEAVALDPGAQERRRSEREEILGLFDQPMYVEEIPNGYCNQWCCRAAKA